MSGPVVRSPGRPRSAETERATLDAAIDLLVDVGFGGMSMEAVATRAGVGKAAIYRRFSSKEQLVVEALRSHSSALVPLVDTGDLRADLLAMLQGAQRAMAGDDGPVMCAFVSEKARYPELHDEYQRAFVAERRAHVQALIASAVKRGELPPSTDVELFAEFGPAVLAHRLMVGGTEPDADLPRRIVAQLLGPSS